MCGPILLGGLLLIVAEFALLVEVGTRVGALPTVGLTIVTAAVGLWAAQDQGLATVERIRSGQLRGQGPTNVDMVDGSLVALAAVFLFIPGFITDVMGALLLLPPLRRLVATAISRRMGPPRGGPPGSGPPGGGRVFVVHKIDPPEPPDP
ncbi:MAG: FxsA family protein [bacterium]